MFNCSCYNGQIFCRVQTTERYGHRPWGLCTRGIISSIPHFQSLSLSLLRKNMIVYYPFFLCCLLSCCMSDDYQNSVVNQITLIQAHWLSLMVCELFSVHNQVEISQRLYIVRDSKYDLFEFNSNKCDCFYRVFFNCSSRC